MSQSKKELFLELAQPDKNGVSRWVSVTEFIRVSDSSTQTFDDFQALCKAYNDKKRQICKKCKESGYRFDATKIPGNRYPFYEGAFEYDGCVGCYQYDPIQYRKTCNDRIFNEGYQIGYHQKTTL